MAQFLRPDGNVTQTSFTNGFAEIDEATASDADFAYGANNTAAVLEVSLANPSGTPGSGTCTVRYRIAKTNAGTVDGGGNAVTVTGEAYQGTTQIATDSARTADGTWTEYSFTFAAAAVSDWTDVRLRFTTSASGGSPANRRGGAVSWAELETPNAASPVQADPGTGLLTATGFAPTVSATANTQASPGVGAAVLAGFAPTVSATAHQTVTPGVGAATLAGFAPTVTASDHQTVTHGVGVLTATGYAPTVTAGAGGGTTASPGTGQLTATGFAPVVTATAHVTVTPAVGVLVATGYAPVVTASAHVTVTPGVAALVASGFAPAVLAPVQVETATGLLLFAGYAPTVTVASGAQHPVRAVAARSRARFTPTFTGGRSHGSGRATNQDTPAAGGGPTIGATFGDGNG